MPAEAKSVHEPEAELLALDEVLEGAEVVRTYLERKGKIQSESTISLRVPLWVVIEAIDQLEEPVLRQVVQHVEKRLTLVSSAAHAEV
jgi:PII-like signaling protein